MSRLREHTLSHVRLFPVLCPEIPCCHLGLQNSRESCIEKLRTSHSLFRDSNEFKMKLLRLAFEFMLSQFGLVNEKKFYRDMAVAPYHRTAYYSPLLLNVLLGIGSRYLVPGQDEFPVEICSSREDMSTRGDTFIQWARYRRLLLSGCAVIVLLTADLLHSHRSGVESP